MISMSLIMDHLHSSTSTMIQATNTSYQQHPSRLRALQPSHRCREDLLPCGNLPCSSDMVRRPRGVEDKLLRHWQLSNWPIRRLTYRLLFNRRIDPGCPWTNLCRQCQETARSLHKEVYRMLRCTLSVNPCISLILFRGL